MRLFIALNLPGGERERIHRSIRPLRDLDLPIRWAEMDTLHVTLKFLGEVHPDRKSSVERAMRRVADATPAFTVDLVGVGAFPTIRKPRVLWLGVGATPELRCLKQDLEWALGDCGFDVETRAFHPHVTLGRADDRRGAGTFRGLDQVVAGMRFRGRLSVRCLDLMRSRLSRSGPRYGVVATARLTRP